MSANIVRYEPEIVTPAPNRSMMPVMSVDQAVERYNSLVDIVQRMLKKDVDYGAIPGTGKPTLLKPGAEKLTTFFGLSTRFELIERIEDWSGEAHEGEPFFYYLYRCQLWRGDLLIAESDGSCNSREAKYRFREAQRVCPDCKKPTIIRGKEEYGGGYLCFKKKGGCGAKFTNGDVAIESQPSGRAPNQDIADSVNTMQKMAQKRAMVAATLLAVNASEFFTQDMEDIHPSQVIAAASVATTPVNFTPAANAAVAAATTDDVETGESDQAECLAEVRRLCTELNKLGDSPEWTGARLKTFVQNMFSADVNDLNEIDLSKLIKTLRGRKNGLPKQGGTK